MQTKQPGDGATLIIATLTLIISTFTTVHSQSVLSGARNMGSILNSGSTEQNVTISPTGLSLYFSTNRSPSLGGQDIWVSKRATLNSPWGPPQHLGPILNSTGNEAVQSFSYDGLTVYLQSTRDGGHGGFDIYVSTRTEVKDDLGWSTPVNLGPPVNSSTFDGGACFFQDPTTGVESLIITSNRNGDPQFDFHLYQSTRSRDGTFTEPVMIDQLSTIGLGAELRPAIRRDGLEIFFASARPGGVEPPAFDIWVSTRTSTSSPWNTPELIRGLNTTGEDGGPALSPDGAILFFQSNRSGTLGGNDLYTATRCSLYSEAPCIVNRTVSDFNADGITDLSIFRPSDGAWWIEESGTGAVSVRRFGASGDRIVPGDYDGDGRLDLAMFRPADVSWWVLRSSDSSFTVTQFGLPTDTPTPGDYDGDGTTDIAVYRDGAWHIRRSTGGDLTRQFGSAGDIPVAGVQ